MYKFLDISVVLPSYNNLEYLKLAYKHIREISKDIELILCDDNSDDGTSEWLTSLNEENNIIKIFDKKIGHPRLYDIGFNITERKIIGILHADMVVHKDFFHNILKYIGKNNVVCGICAEPPIHTPGNEKYILDAGFYPSEFNNIKFEEFFTTIIKGKTNNGIFAPWFLLKEDYINKIGKHDNLFNYCEDVDLFNRMVLANLNIIQSRDALVYHFTQRGHKFEKGIIGKVQSDYQSKVEKDTRNYIRKWGNIYKFDENHRPILSTKYNIGFIVKNCDQHLLGTLEPWCSTIYVDCDYKEYIKQEQPNTKFDLQERIKPYDNKKQNEILIEFDASKFEINQFSIIQQLNDIIKDSGEIGSFELDNLKITINSMNEYQNSLIKL
jgi:glycosyltransferase involved in cell wall biosynthesis